MKPKPEVTTTDRHDADEGAEGRVARTLFDELIGSRYWAQAPGHVRDEYHRLARAVLAELAAPGTDSSGQVEQREIAELEQEANESGKRLEALIRVRAERDQLRQRVLDRADELARMPTLVGGYAAERLRAAVAGPQRDHDKEGS